MKQQHRRPGIGQKEEAQDQQDAADLWKGPPDRVHLENQGVRMKHEQRKPKEGRQAQGEVHLGGPERALGHRGDEDQRVCKLAGSVEKAVQAVCSRRAESIHSQREEQRRLDYRHGQWLQHRQSGHGVQGDVLWRPL